MEHSSNKDDNIRKIEANEIVKIIKMKQRTRKLKLSYYRQFFADIKMINYKIKTIFVSPEKTNIRG